jgi:hypothetical protein
MLAAYYRSIFGVEADYRHGQKVRLAWMQGLCLRSKTEDLETGEGLDYRTIRAPYGAYGSGRRS